MSSQSVATFDASGTTSDAVKLSATHAVHAVFLGAHTPGRLGEHLTH